MFNVAADDVLSVSQVLSILGRPGVGLPPSLRPIGDFFGGRNAVKVNNDQLALLTYGRVMDITRFTATTGVRPQYSSRRAVEEFAAFGEPGMLSSHRVDALIEQVAHVLSPRNARAEAEQTPYGDPLGFAEGGEWSDAADPAEEFGEAPEPEAPPNESPNELGHLLGDLLDLAARAMTRIKDVPPETWQEIVEDPLSAHCSAPMPSGG